MRREWDVDALIESWTLYDADRELIGQKYGATKLGFCLLLKYFEIEGRFPRRAGDIPAAAVEFVSSQVRVDPAEFSGYDWAGRTIKNHRAQIRATLGFRETSVGDRDKLAGWLAEQVCPSELNTDRQREALLARCRVVRLKPPSRLVCDRIIGAANRMADERFCTATLARLSPEVIAALDALVAEDPTDDGEDAGGTAGFFTELKADPRQLGLETLLAEIRKLGRARAIGLPTDLFTDIADKRLATWRARAVAEYPSTLRRDHPRLVRLPLLAVLCWCRLTEITDSLVDLFIQLVHRINTRAQRRVEKEMIAEFRRVGGKEDLLFRVAEATVDAGDRLVWDTVFPVAPRAVLRDLVAESKATQAARRARVRTVLEGSYSHHYRTMLPKLLDALAFRCNNTAHRPVMDAVELLHRYKDRDGRATHYDPTERVPLDGVVRPDWREAVVDGRGRVERIPYELSTLGGAAGRDPAAGDLGGRRREVAQPRD
ncbi:DUF4158 domain-containing protein [Actinocrispum wychmicini]|uniref:Uncharacterized protein DUF4158 n=1 Tax=Actinocrispum wychmicini TaxID=1213861 RepID=A0A4R2JL28_9PSEU|nr:DUF4158 domain-containing protein [Actinocrispum wychmicini]TCO60753.1 uncharacterized protein DUF4158 [Actinocrispum wychmicini]